MKSLSSLILVILSAVAIVTADEANLMFWPGTLDSKSEMSCIIDERHITITINATTNSHPFWSTRDAGRPPLVVLGLNLPTLTLARDIGTKDEIRFVVRPENRNTRTSPTVIKRYLENIPLLIEDMKVGSATLASMDGEKDNRKVVFILDRLHFASLGEEFLLLSGNPIAKQISTKAEQDAP